MIGKVDLLYLLYFYCLISWINLTVLQVLFSHNLTNSQLWRHSLIYLVFHNHFPLSYFSANLLQDKLVLKNFDIRKEALGVDKEVIKVFKAVVNVKTLEIRFHWAGRGTTNVPQRGKYGSLISAISVQSGK